MFKYAVFAGHAYEYKQFLQDQRISPEEAIYIISENDIQGLPTDVEIVMYGSYYEQGEWYTALSDTLLELNHYGNDEVAMQSPQEPYTVLFDGEPLVSVIDEQNIVSMPVQPAKPRGRPRKTKRK